MSILIVLNFLFLVGTAFASSLYVPSVPQHCSETHGCSLCGGHEQNSYHGDNEYFFGEGSSMAGSNRWQYQARGCNWSTCLYPFLFWQTIHKLHSFYLRMTKIKLIYSNIHINNLPCSKKKTTFCILFWSNFFILKYIEGYLYFITEVFTQKVWRIAT